MQTYKAQWCGILNLGVPFFANIGFVNNFATDVFHKIENFWGDFRAATGLLWFWKFLLPRGASKSTQICNVVHWKVDYASVTLKRHAFSYLSLRGSFVDYIGKRFEQQRPPEDINNCIIKGKATMCGPMTLAINCNFDVLVLWRCPTYRLHMHLATILTIWWKWRSILTKQGPEIMGVMWNF